MENENEIYIEKVHGRKSKAGLHFKGVVQKVLVSSLVLTSVLGSTSGAFAAEPLKLSEDKIKTIAYEDGISIETAISQIKNTISTLKLQITQKNVKKESLETLASQLYQLEKSANGKSTPEIVETISEVETTVSGIKENEQVMIALQQVKDSLGISTVKARKSNAASSEIAFADVKPSDWFYNSVMDMAKQEYLLGTGATNELGEKLFDVQSSMTRAAYVTIAVRIAYGDELKNTVVEGGNWWDAAYTVAQNHGILSATDPDFMSNPSGEIRREEMALILQRTAHAKGVSTANLVYATQIPDFQDVKGYYIMTVKTFALDFEDDGLYGSVKSSWENDWYDSYEQHKNLLSAIDTQQKANASEKLLIDSPNYGSIDYTGGTLNAPTNKYEKRNYNHYSNAVGGGDAVVFEHKLIVRGGKLVAIIPQNRSSLAYGSPISIEALKSSDTALYNALVAMNLYDEGGDKNNTIFKNFEHKSGDALTEGSYVSKLNEARKVKDNGFDSSSQAGVSVGEGWYSEDTTVLVVKEYVSNYNVPSIAFSEKVALSVNGLITPQNKAQFFSVMGKGYSYLKYDYPLKSWYTTLSQNVNAYFEYTSFPNDTFSFGEQQVDYLVPNVSILDVTTIS